MRIKVFTLKPDYSKTANDDFERAVNEFLGRTFDPKVEFHAVADRLVTVVRYEEEGGYRQGVARRPEGGG